MTHEERLDAALDSWLAMRGTVAAPSVELFLARHADLADELRQLLLAMEELDGLRSMPCPGPDDETAVIAGVSYAIGPLLGRGGMGEVHLASRRDTGAKVAIKTLASAHAADPERRLRFQREALIGERLRHPSIVAVRAQGTFRDLPCLVMDFVDGVDLGVVLGRLRSRPPGDLRTCDLGAVVRDCAAAAPSPSAPNGAAAHDRDDYYHTVARLIAALGRALQHAHDQGVVHRDVKPQNVLLDADLQPHLLDFGLAVGRDDPLLSRSGDQVGTLHYMSPEMLRLGATRVGHRTDVYSLGVTLYELVTLSLPFAGPSSPAVMRSIERDPTPWPRQRNPEVPLDLQGIVLRALDKDPRRRYPTAATMVADLERFLHGQRVLARTPGLLRRGRSWLARHRRAVVAAVLLSCIGIAAQAWSWRQRQVEFGQQVQAAELHRQYDRVHAEFAALERAIAIRPQPELVRRLRHLEGHRVLVVRGVPVDAEVRVQRLPSGPARRPEPIQPSATQLGELQFDVRGGDYTVWVGAADRCAEQFVPIDRQDPFLVEPEPRATAELLADMVVFPAGAYEIGEDTIDLAPVFPRQVLEVAAFALDRTEVSNADYARFCAATGHRPPPSWDGPAPDRSVLDLPVVMVSFDDACAYATWAGKRLPSAIEWEIAARGRERRPFPWGDAVTGVDVAMLGPHRLRDDSIVRVEPASLRPVGRGGDDRTPEGLLHLAGNVAEWTLDPWLPRIDDPASDGPRPRGERVQRGGSVSKELDPFRCLENAKSFPERRSADVGFRCAISLL